MNRTYHVITPFRRFENLEAQYRMLQDMPVRWHLILDSGLPWEPVFGLHGGSWIQKGFCPRSAPFWSFWADALNRFISSGPLEPEDYYGILNDDDAYEPDFFHKLDRHTGDVIVASMKRGHQIPPGVIPERAHGTDTLEAKPENMQVGRVGAEQLFCKGKIFEKYGFNNTITADGERICAIVKDHPVDYAPEAFVWFNYLEFGRWNK